LSADSQSMSVTFDAMKRLAKFLSGLVVAASVAIVLLIVIPMPSFQRSIAVTNQFPTAVEVKCKTIGGWRGRTFRLEPSEYKKFVYFTGDHGGSTTIPVLIQARILSNSFEFKRQLDLPIDNQPSGVALSEKWFEPVAIH
jgi:hypothetical protein